MVKPKASAKAAEEKPTVYKPKGITLDNGVHINYLDGFEWRWLCEEEIHWHTSYLIDFIAADGERYVILKCEMIMAYGVKGSKCDKALEEFKGMLEANYKDESLSLEKRTAFVLNVDVPNMRRFKVDENSDQWCKELWDEGRSHSKNDGPLFEIGFTAEKVRTYDDGDIEREIECARFDEWRAKSTEFSKETFFAKVREVMGEYELEEQEKGDDLVFTGLTAKLKISHIDDKGKLVESNAQLNCRITASYNNQCCGIDATICGHGEHCGSCSPVKTMDDLRRVEAPFGSKLKRKPVQEVHYEQMSLFDFCQEVQL